jgi:hypothetical protein
MVTTMARDESPICDVGKTLSFFTDDLGQTIDPTGGKNLEGKEWVSEDLDYANSSSSGVTPVRSGKYVTRRLVRNANSSTYAKPKEFWAFKLDGATADVYGGQVAAAGTTAGQRGGFVDEFLPPAGAAPGTLFWVVTKGPAKALTATTGDTNISVGSGVIAGPAGGILDQDTTVAAGAATFNQVNGRLGYAMEAKNATAADIMILVG